MHCGCCGFISQPAELCHQSPGSVVVLGLSDMRMLTSHPPLPLPLPTAARARETRIGADPPPEKSAGFGRPPSGRRPSDAAAASPAGPTFGGSYSFSQSSTSAPRPDVVQPSASMRRASQEDVEARMQERKAEFTQEQREREVQENARAEIRDKVKKNLSRVEVLTDISMVCGAQSYALADESPLNLKFHGLCAMP